MLIFVKKVLKANIFAFDKTILLIPSLTLTNMSNRFFGFFTLFFFIFFKNNFFRDYWGVDTALSKIMRIFCKRLRRKRLSKLPTLSYFFQLPHSAMIDFVINSPLSGKKLNKNPEEISWMHWLRSRLAKPCKKYNERTERT